MICVLGCGVLGVLVCWCAGVLACWCAVLVDGPQNGPRKKKVLVSSKEGVVVEWATALRVGNPLLES